MALTTPKTTLFGAPGASDPVVLHPGLVCIKRKFDFSDTPVDITNDGADQTLFGIPKSFVVLGAFFESDADKGGAYPATAGTVTLKIADSTGGADVAIGTAFAPSATAYKRTTALLSAAKAFDSVDSTAGTLPAFATFGANMTKGVVTVGLIGFVPDGDSLNNVVTPEYRASGQTQTNVAGVDPYQISSVRG